MSLTFELIEPGIGRNVLVSEEEIIHRINLSYPCESQEFCTGYKSTFPKGSFYFEVFGSQGGNSIGGSGGFGSFISGVLSLDSPTMVFLHVGGRSSAKTVAGSSNSAFSYNGGGKSGYAHSNAYGTPGGGGSDIRLEVNDFNHRIIVAGGGGGGGIWDSQILSGGCGGGLIGGNGTKYIQSYEGSGGGSQTSGGSGGSSQASGIFGEGSSTSYAGSGGGGGWFGGSAGYSGGSGGGGGSGYINSYSSHKPSGYAFESRYFIEEPNIISCKNDGNGRISITILSHFQSISLASTNICSCIIFSLISLIIFVNSFMVFPY